LDDPLFRYDWQASAGSILARKLSFTAAHIAPQFHSFEWNWISAGVKQMLLSIIHNDQDQKAARPRIIRPSLHFSTAVYTREESNSSTLASPSNTSYPFEKIARRHWPTNSRNFRWASLDCSSYSPAFSSRFQKSGAEWTPAVPPFVEIG
jgi:hypothetical protein